MQIFKTVPVFYSSVLPTAQQVQDPDLQAGLPLHCLPLQLSQKAQTLTATTALICTEQGFVVSFPVPLHHPTSALGLHHLCCLPDAPRERNHAASLHLERSLLSILAWIYTLTSWIFNIPPTHRQRDNLSASPARTADTLKHMNQRLPAVFLQCYLTTSTYRPCVGTNSNTAAWLTALLWLRSAKLSPLLMQPQLQGRNAVPTRVTENRGSAPNPPLFACQISTLNPALTPSLAFSFPTCNTAIVTCLQKTKKLTAKGKFCSYSIITESYVLHSSFKVFI